MTAKLCRYIVRVDIIDQAFSKIIEIIKLHFILLIFTFIEPFLYALLWQGKQQ